MFNTLGNKLCVFLAESPHFDPSLPLVESFRDHLEVWILEEKSNHCLLHVLLLHGSVLFHVFVNFLWIVPLLSHELFQAVYLPLHSISLQHHISFSLQIIIRYFCLH